HVACPSGVQRSRVEPSTLRSGTNDGPAPCTGARNAAAAAAAAARTRRVVCIGSTPDTEARRNDEASSRRSRCTARAALERQTGRELHQPRLIALRCHLSERAGGRRAHLRVGHAELYAVEQVERFGTERQVHAVAE